MVNRLLRKNIHLNNKKLINFKTKGFAEQVHDRAEINSNRWDET